MAIPGSIVASGKLVTPGGAGGPAGATGPAGPAGPTAVSTDAGNIATLGSDSKILVPQSALWNMRLRSLNAIDNPNFECDQRLAGATTGAVALCDRWFRVGVPTAPVITGQKISAPAVIPGTNYRITNNALQFTLTTAGSVPTNQAWGFQQTVEGNVLRPLFQDVTSISILAASSVASFVFPVILSNGVNSSSGGWCIGYLCTTSPTPNTPTLITIPNIPVWPGTEGTEWFTTPGQLGYQIRFSLCAAASSSIGAAAIGQWLRPPGGGNIWGVAGQTNFGALATGSTFTLYYVQHEPGPVCSTLMDKPFTQNLDECLRYYTKSYDYGTKAGTASNPSGQILWCTSQASTTFYSTIFFKKVLAVTPTVVAYSPSTGAPNTIRDTTNSVDRTVNSYVSTGLSSSGGVLTAVASPAGSNMAMHYTADTGW